MGSNNADGRSSQFSPSNLFVLVTSDSTELAEVLSATRSDSHSCQFGNIRVIRGLKRVGLPIPSDMKPDPNLALLVRLEAKPGKEAETEQFLKAGLAIAQEEAGTTTWFALKLGPSTFGIFDTFVEEAGREAHLSGRLAAALMQKASELLAQPPTIEKVAVLAAKLS
jgi:quinol monooxygenase YgiN